MDAKDTERFLELLQQLQFEDDDEKGDPLFEESFNFVRKAAMTHFEDAIRARVAKRTGVRTIRKLRRFDDEHLL